MRTRSALLRTLPSSTYRTPSSSPICFMCTALPLYVNEELRAITKNHRSLDSAVMMSSLIPSEKYSCSRSPLMLLKGSTAIAGRSGNGKAEGDRSSLFSASRSAGRLLFDGFCSCTVPTKRRPFREIVRISFWSLPLSPTAVRAALTRLVNVESETVRPSQTWPIRSSLLTTRSRFCTR